MTVGAGSTVVVVVEGSVVVVVGRVRSTVCAANPDSGNDEDPEQQVTAMESQALTEAELQQLGFYPRFSEGDGLGDVEEEDDEMDDEMVVEREKDLLRPVVVEGTCLKLPRTLPLQQRSAGQEYISTL
jgi:hypothetical protein